MRNAILDEMQFQQESGRLTFKGVRYLLIRPELLAEITRGIQALSREGTDQILFDAGKRGGTLSSRRFREAFGHTAEETIRFMVTMGPEIGWGGFTLTHLDVPGKRFALEVRDSPFAEALRPSPAPTCALIRGVMAGVGEVALGQPVQSTEVRCLAVGDAVCRFEVRG